MLAEARYIDDQSGRDIHSVPTRFVPVPNVPTRDTRCSGIMCPDQRKVNIGPILQKLADQGCPFGVVRRRSAKKMSKRIA